MDLFSLRGKVIVITGGDGLLGKEYRKYLENKGAQVISLDVKRGYNITDEEQMHYVILNIIAVYGKIDVLINNAAINRPAKGKHKTFTEFSTYAWRHSLEVNLTGMFIITKEVIKYMIEDKIKGSIINVSSTYGLVAPNPDIYTSLKGFEKPIDYSTTKSAVLNFTRHLAALYGKYGIRVNTLTPGGVFNNQKKAFVKKYTKLTPLGRMADKTDYNGAVHFLCSDASKYMTGANLVIDGGFTCW